MRSRVAARTLVGIVLALTACGSSDAPSESADDVLKRALADHRAGRLEQAERAYHEVLSHDARNKFAYYNIGLIAQQTGSTALAEANYRAALSIDAEYWPALYNLALLKGVASGGRAEAEILYRKVIAVNPMYAPAYLNLGLLLRTLKRTKEAEAMLKKAFELDPSLRSGASPSPSMPGPQSSR